MSLDFDLDLNITNVRFQDDPIFNNMDETLKGLSYIYFKYYKLWNKMKSRYDQLQYDVSMGKIDAGYIYNKSLALGSEFDIPMQTYNIILESFKTYMASTKMKNYVSSDLDAETYTWNLCHYFFVPVRLLEKTIPKHIRFDLLKRWMTTCLILPMVDPYTNKFHESIRMLQEMKQIAKGIEENPSAMDKLEAVSKPFIDSVIKTSRSNSSQNPSSTLLKTSMNIFILASIEILRKFCPNYEDCCRINPDYSGLWIDPLDSLCGIQMNKINGLCDLTI